MTELADALAAGAEAIGPGVAPYRAALPEGTVAHAIAGPSPEGLWRAAASVASAGKTLPPEALRAVYLRQSYAEMGVHVPKNPPKKSPFV